MFNEASRMAEGANFEPARHVLVLSNGTPKTMNRASSKGCPTPEKTWEGETCNPIWSRIKTATTLG